MARHFKLPATRLDEFLRTICEGHKVFAPEQQDAQYHLAAADGWIAGKHTLGAYRTVQPLKALVFPPRESLGPLSGAAHSAVAPRMVVGVKNCDLSALKIHDYVFLKTDPVDPSYAEAREKTVIVSADCTAARDVCFCPAVGEQPYAKEGFDINISTTPRGYIVESGSAKGEKLLDKAKHLLDEADKSLLDERDRQRTELTRHVCAQTEGKGLKCDSDLRAAIRNAPESKLWDEFAEDCVECGACNLICCTCHCFLLADGLSDGDKPARVKQWDSCLYRNFAVVAGGANPRKHRAERLQNRFDKKFNFFPEVLGCYACDGCGRCIEACAGKIDIREVLKKAVNEL